MAVVGLRCHSDRTKRVETVRLVVAADLAEDDELVVPGDLVRALPVVVRSVRAVAA